MRPIREENFFAGGDTGIIFEIKDEVLLNRICGWVALTGWEADWCDCSSTESIVVHGFERSQDIVRERIIIQNCEQQLDTHQTEIIVD